MGREIATTRIRAEDFERYSGRCKRELALLRTRLAQGRLSARGSVAGVELEARLVDDAGQPRPINDAFPERHGPDLGALVRVYREYSHAGAPVHTWDV